MPLTISCSTCFAEFESWEALSVHRASHYGNTGARESLMERAREDRALRIAMADARMRAYVPSSQPYITRPMVSVRAEISEEHRAWESEKCRRRGENYFNRLPLARWLSPTALARDDELLKTKVFEEGRHVTEETSEPVEDAYYGPYGHSTGYARGSKLGSSEKICCHRRECADRWDAPNYVCPHLWTPESIESIAARFPNGV